MSAFPYRELEVVRLAQDVVKGLTENPETFPAPPVTVQELESAINAYHAARDMAVTASAGARQSTEAKDKAMQELTVMLRASLRYSEGVTRNDNAKLQLVGWGVRKPGTAVERPGAVSGLRVREENENTITLEWDVPFEGGQPVAYKVQRRKRDTAWTDVGMSVEPHVVLTGQELGVELEYRVFAVNKAGAGTASNSVRAVL